MLFLSACLSVCANNIWELTPLQPLKYAPNGRRPYFIGFKCADFLTNAAVSEKKQVKTWPIEIVLRVTPPFKVHMLSRRLVGSACASRSVLRPSLSSESLPIVSLANIVVVNMPPFRKICPDCGIHLHTKKLKCPCGHSFRRGSKPNLVNNKTLSRARDPRANGAWLSKLTE